VKNAWIQQHSGEFTIEIMCWVLQVSRSTYYSWLQCDESVGKNENVDLPASLKPHLLRVAPSTGPVVSRQGCSLKLDTVSRRRM